MPGVPIDPAADTAAVFDGMAEVTVYRTDPDTGTEDEVASGVPAHQSAVRDADSPVGARDETGADASDWLICAPGGMAFTPRARDVVEEEDGTRWSVNEVTTDGLLHWLPGCTKLRS